MGQDWTCGWHYFVLAWIEAPGYIASLSAIVDPSVICNNEVFFSSYCCHRHSEPRCLWFSIGTCLIDEIICKQRKKQEVVF
jgi:hypothetical protein